MLVSYCSFEISIKRIHISVFLPNRVSLSFEFEKANLDFHGRVNGQLLLDDSGHVMGEAMRWSY